ncbi:MAG TPA: LysR family transcriptional regulator, partial [Bradyrhizobium sp.]
MVSSASLPGLSGKRPPSKSALKASSLSWSLSCRAMVSSIGCCWSRLSGSFVNEGVYGDYGEHLSGFQMSDRLQELAVFARAAESGSFSKAARELGLSQPSVSRIIGELEARLGVKLLLRTT